MSSHRLTQIDELHLAEFPYLRADDDCYYLGEYTVRQGYDFSTTNDLVINLKKGLEYKNGPAWKYKARAIRTCAAAFLAGVGSEWLHTVTLVPIPPSKAKSDPAFDDRMLQILRALEASASVRCDVRELIIQRRSYDPSHSSSGPLDATLRALDAAESDVRFAHWLADEAFARAGGVASWVASTLEGLCGLVGEEGLAGRIRITPQWHQTRLSPAESETGW